MRPAGRPRFAARSTTPLRTSPESPRNVASSREFVASAERDPSPDTEVILAQAGFVNTQSLNNERPIERLRHLVIAIRQRIESRLPGRVRGLVVRAQGDTIVLEGRCATYYTKQLAQHAAMSIPGGDRLINSIEVS